MRRAPVIARVGIALSMAVLLTAHVGSPDVYFAGKAGPYQTNVTIQPPSVVPGIATVYVTVPDTTVTGVVIRPVYWRAGSKGAPIGDSATRVPGSRDLFEGKLWLMASGSYSVHVTVTGPAGSGTVIVPVASVATGQLALTPLLTILLGVLATLLVAGVITAVHAATGESQLAPGETMTPEVRRRARRGALIAVPVLAFVVLGAANWWQSEADRYRATLYRPIQVRSTITTETGIPTLTVSVTDQEWRSGIVTPIMPDHGKLAHMFVVGVDSPHVFMHLHPDMPDRNTFVTALPPIPAGRYRVFTDVVHESGFERTLVDSITLAAPIDSSGLASMSADEAWTRDRIMGTGNTYLGDYREHDGNVFMRWAGTLQPVAGRPDGIRIGIFDQKAKAITLEPYLGMLGHAVVVRDDGKVFIHLHPNGTSSMASQQAFVLRDRGDTTRNGRLRLEAPMEMAMPDGERIRELVFPYAFPDTGHYNVFVQVRREGAIHTTAFRVNVRR